jgi:hypothetical protein
MHCNIFEKENTGSGEKAHAAVVGTKRFDLDAGKRGRLPQAYWALRDNARGAAADFPA